MDDTPDTGSLLVVVVEDSLDIGGVLQIAAEDLDLGVGLVLLGSIGAKLPEGDLRDTVQGFGERVIVAGFTILAKRMPR